MTTLELEMAHERAVEAVLDYGLPLTRGEVRERVNYRRRWPLHETEVMLALDRLVEQRVATVTDGRYERDG